MKNIYKNLEDVLEHKDDVINLIKNFLNISEIDLTSESIQDNIKELACLKLCKVVGLNFKYNPKNDFFSFFSLVMAEGVCQKLNLPLNFAPPELKFVKYDGVNFVTTASEKLKNLNIDEAFLDMFILIDNNRYVVKDFFRWQNC